MHNNFLLTLLVVALACCSTESMQLIQVQFVTRHGDRTPAYDIASAPLKNSYNWTDCINEYSLYSNASAPVFEKIYFTTALPGTCHLGQLTRTGMQQLKNLGKSFAEQYKMPLELADLYDARQVRIESTDVHRTIMSAKSFLMGLYPTLSDLPAREIAIYTQDAEISDLFPNARTCPILNKLLAQIQDSVEWKQHEQELQPFKKELATILQMDVEQLPNWIALYDAFICRRAHDAPLIAGMTNEYVDKLIQIAEWQWSMYMNQSNPLSLLYSKLGMYAVLQRIKQRMLDAINDQNSNQQAYKLIMYSAHDTSIAALLGLWARYNQKWPSYASHLVLELYYKSDAATYHVQVKYNGDELVLPHCATSMCPLDTFFSLPTEIASYDVYRKQCTVQ